MRFGLKLTAALAALLALGTLCEPTHAGPCTWQADPLPHFPPGVPPVVDVQEQVTIGSENILGEWRAEQSWWWTVIVQPGYMYGDACAWDQQAWLNSNGSVTVDKSGARVAWYNVISVDRCVPTPPHTIKAQTSITFDTWVKTNAPAEAEATGLTHVLGTLTGLDKTGTAGCYCGVEDPGANPKKVKVGFDKNGVHVEVEITLACGEDEQTDAAGAGGSATAPVLDEEYVITHDVHVRAKADAHLLNTVAEADALVYNHILWIKTTCDCGYCAAHAVPQVTIDKSTYQVNERNP